MSKNFFAIAGTTLILLGILIGGYVLSREFKSISAQQTINVITPENVEENCCYSYEWDFLAKVPKVETWLLRHTLNQIKQTKHEQNR